MTLKLCLGLSMLLGLIALACSMPEPTSVPNPTAIPSAATSPPSSTSLPIPTQAAKEPATVDKPAPANIKIVRVPGTITSIDESVQLSAEVRNSSGEVLNGVPLDWSSSLPSVATLVTKGRLRQLAMV